MPGRVVWMYDTDSVLWDGDGYWWKPENFDEKIIQDMVDDSIASLGGEATAKDGWNALYSVGVDFLINEPTVIDQNGALRDNPNVENYLHEARLVRNAPSGNVYQNGNGETVTNLGVHEHWNNSVEKLYSGNLERNEGIELISIIRHKQMWDKGTELTGFSS